MFGPLYDDKGKPCIGRVNFGLRIVAIYVVTLLTLLYMMERLSTIPVLVIFGFLGVMAVITYRTMLLRMRHAGIPHWVLIALAVATILAASYTASTFMGAAARGEKPPFPIFGMIVAYANWLFAILLVIAPANVIQLFRKGNKVQRT